MKSVCAKVIVYGGFDFAKVTKKNEASADINIISCKTEVENKLSPISALVMIQITTQIMAQIMD